MVDQPIPISEIADPDLIRVQLLASGRPVHAPLNALPGALDIIVYVAARAELKAIDTTRTAVIYLTEAGREGVFIWTPGNFSSQVTADTLEGIYIKADAIASSSGAWVRAYKGLASVSWFNNGGTSITSALLAALTVASQVYLDAGSYTTSQVAFPANSKLVMHRSAVIAPTAAYSGSLFTLATDAVWIEGGTFNVNTTTFSTTKVISGNGATRATVKNILMTAGGLNGVHLQDCQNCLVENVEVQASAGRGIYVVKSSTVSAYNKVVRCKSFAAANGHGIQCESGSYNTIEDCYAHGSKAFGHNLYLETHSTIVSCRAENTEAEGINITGTLNCSVLNCNVRWGAVAGGFTSVDFGMSMDGETTDCNFNTFSNNHIEGCGKSGIAIAGNSQFNLIVDNTIQDVNNLAEANKAGVLIYGAGAVNNQVHGNQLFGDANMHYGVRDESTGRNIIGPNNSISAATAETSLNANTVDFTGDPKTSTPTVTAASGTITTKSATCNYRKMGNRYDVELVVTITTNGTGAGNVQATLPFTPTEDATLVGREVNSVGKALTGQISSGAALVVIFNYDNTYPGGSGYKLVLNGNVKG